MKELVQILKSNKLCIGSCESVTAGLFASTLAEVSGASAVLKGAIVTYQTSCKVDLVHVDQSIIDSYGVISGPCAIEMAEKSRALLDVDICVSCTGNAGPQGMEGKPSGLSYCAVTGKYGTKVYALQMQGERNDVRRRIVEEMGKYVIQYVESAI